MTDKEKIMELIAIIDESCRDIRARHVDDSVCGVCEYDADHGPDGYANECPGFEKDDCFCLSHDFKMKYLQEPEEPHTEYMPEYEKLKERDRAKKPSYVDDNMGYFMCANCGGKIYYSGDKESHEFCLICGQRIDWTEQENGGNR